MFNGAVLEISVSSGLLHQQEIFLIKSKLHHNDCSSFRVDTEGAADDPKCWLIICIPFGIIELVKLMKDIHLYLSNL